MHRWKWWHRDSQKTFLGNFSSIFPVNLQQGVIWHWKYSFLMSTLHRNCPKGVQKIEMFWHWDWGGWEHFELRLHLRSAYVTWTIANMSHSWREIQKTTVVKQISFILKNILNELIPFIQKLRICIHVYYYLVHIRLAGVLYCNNSFVFFVVHVTLASSITKYLSVLSTKIVPRWMKISKEIVCSMPRGSFSEQSFAQSMYSVAQRWSKPTCHHNDGFWYLEFPLNRSLLCRPPEWMYDLREAL